MMEERDQARDESWIREVCTRYVPGETVYIRREYYDGGYEIRVGSYTFFAEYEVIDHDEVVRMEGLLRKGGLLL